MFGLGMPELIIILVVALIFFGPGKLPELGSGLGKAIRSFKKASTEGDDAKEEKKKVEAEKPATV
jgi:sec-independent protein translocase protein TatA